ncbi:Uncharacterised protein [Raoultella planticola]|nr:Uncharacterised protein [Raoultella planticola]
MVNQPGVQYQLHFLTVAGVAQTIVCRAQSRQRRSRPSRLADDPPLASTRICAFSAGFFGSRHRRIKVDHRWAKRCQQVNGLPCFFDANRPHLAKNGVWLANRSHFADRIPGCFTIGQYRQNHLRRRRGLFEGSRDGLIRWLSNPHPAQGYDSSRER